jgi:hypothetical protein
MRRMRRNHDQTKKTTWKPVTIRGRLIRISGRQVSRRYPRDTRYSGLFPRAAGNLSRQRGRTLDPQPHRCEAFSWL